MSDELLGATGSPAVGFAFPRSDGGWSVLNGHLEFVDGYLHKVSMPGLEARSGEAFGLTVTFHVVRASGDRGGVLVGTIGRLVFQNGRMASSEVAAEGVALSR
jgi:hypothetical protein